MLCATLAVVLITGVTVAPQPGAAFVATTITIDGNFSDWVGVRADPDNVVTDSQLPDDPDWPGQPDRDVYVVATTYDDQYLYFSWRRTAGGTKAIAFGAYLDYQGNGLLNDGDRVVVWTVSTGGPYASYTNGSAAILHYHQARDSSGTLYHPAGDPMRDTHRLGTPTGDGETPDGYAQPNSGQDVPLQTMDAYLSPNGDGIECEARVAWSDLGVPAGYPFAIHFAAGNGPAWGVQNKPSVTYKSIGGGRFLEEDRGQVEDNIEPIMYVLNRGVTVAPDNVNGGSAGSTLVYAHTVTNESNTAETFTLSAASSRGWQVEVTDSAGVPLTSVALAPHATAQVQVRVTIPPGTAEGNQDVTTLTATSQDDPGVSDSATDTTRVGLVTVSPNQSATMAPGQTIEYSFVVQNNTATDTAYDLTSTSTLGWPVTITDAAGNPIASVSLAGGASQVVKAQISVPPGTPIGTQDVARVRATAQGDPSTTSSATGTTSVADGLVITPDNTGYAGAGSYVQYAHTITNSWPTSRIVQLSATSAQGWPASFYAADGLTPITQITVGPNGATQQVIVRVAVPAGAASGAFDDLTVTAATTTSGTTYTDTAVDRTIVRMLATYADGGFVNQDDAFALGETVYGKASGLHPGDYVYFQWHDTSGALVRTSPSRKVDTQGAAFDECTTDASQPTGNWWVEVYTDQGVLLERTWFSETCDAHITGVSATDAPNVGSSTAVSATTVNHSSAPIADSMMTYVIWWDSNGSGVLDAGDIYIEDTGSPVTWDGTTPMTAAHVTYGIAVPANGTWTDATWTLSNSQFPNQGTYRVTAAWWTDSGVLIDRKTTQFYSIPTLGWPLFGLVLFGAAWLMWRRLPLGGEAA